MTDAEYIAWLSNPSSIRCVLVEASVQVGGVETIRYLSNANYITDATDTPANTAYSTVVIGSLSITEKLSLDGAASLSYGDIELNNEDGLLDSWISDVWTNRAVNIFVGDVRWARSEFRQVFSGTIAGIGSSRRNMLNLDIRDKLQRLNTPMSDIKLGGTTDNKERLKPLCFGECHNIEPMLTNPATLTYQVHDGQIESIIEVRDNGVPVPFTANLTAGTFALGSQPAGVITASVQGDKYGGTYKNTIGPLIRDIITRYGKSTDRLIATDINEPSFSDFSAANPQYVGLYVSERTNVLEVCANLASSVGAQLVMNSLGKVGLLKLAVPAPGTSTAVNADVMVEQTLAVSDRPQIQSSIKIGYCKNWTVQTNLQTGVPEVHKNLFAQEWLAATAEDSLVTATHKLSAESVQLDTMLLTQAQAAAEAARRLALWSTQRTVFLYVGLHSLMLQELGAPQVISYNRYGLSAGKTGQIVGVKRDWAGGRIELEVLT